LVKEQVHNDVIVPAFGLRERDFGDVEVGRTVLQGIGRRSLINKIT
jgi:hypothetical protein